MIPICNVKFAYSVHERDDLIKQGWVNIPAVLLDYWIVVMPVERKMRVASRRR